MREKVGSRGKDVELGAVDQTAKADLLKDVNKSTIDRINKIHDFITDIATNLQQKIQLNLKTAGLVSVAIEEITDAINEFAKADNNDPNYELMMRQTEFICMSSLASLYKDLDKSIERLRTSKLFQTNADLIAIAMKDFIKKEYGNVLETKLSVQEFNQSKKLSGTKLLEVTTEVLKQRVYETSPALPKELAIHEVYISGDKLLPSKQVDFYDGEGIRITKSALPKAAAGLGLFFAKALVTHKLDEGSLGIVREAWQDARVNDSFLFSGKVPDKNVKQVNFLNKKVFSNLDWEPSYEENFNSGLNKTNLTESRLEHVYVVAPGDAQLSKSDTKNNVYFFSEERAKKFIKAAQEHPYWYDSKLGWNFEGWEHKMSPQDKLVSRLEHIFLSERLTRYYLLYEKVKTPVLEETKQELQVLGKLIEDVKKVNSNEDLVRLFKNAIVDLPIKSSLANRLEPVLEELRSEPPKLTRT